MNITNNKSNKNNSVLKRTKKINSILEERNINKIIFCVLILVTCFKVLLIPV